MSRIQQVNSTLQKNLGQIISEKIETPFDFLPTITRIECSPDLKEAKAFVSILPFNKSEDGLNFLIRQKKEIQRLLGRTVKMQFTPVLNFVLDDTEEFASKIYDQLDDLDVN